MTAQRRGWLGHLARCEEGAVALLFAAVLGVLVGGFGLVYDLGRSWTLQSELQAAVDAAALAAATQLDGRPGARTRAIEAATGALARHGQIFDTASGSGAVAFDRSLPCQGRGCAGANESFRFLTGDDPPSSASDDAAAARVEVRATGQVDFVFASVLGGVTRARPSARATAAWQRYACGRAVLLMCNPLEPPGNLDAALTFCARPHRGKGITLRLGAPSGLRRGDFAWIQPRDCDATTHTCALEPSLPAMAAHVSDLRAGEDCRTAATLAPPGLGMTPAIVLNTRLDIYPRAGAGSGSADVAFQPSPHALSGLVRAADAPPGACDFAGGEAPASGALRLPDRAFLGPDRHAPNGAAPLDHVGYPRDNCAYAIESGGGPADDCRLGASPLGTGVWDLPAYMAFHHPGTAVATTRYNRCAAGGCRIGADGDVDLDGDGRLSRWEVHAWERRGALPRLGRPRCFAAGAPPLPPFDAARHADRRLIGALVANCNALSPRAGETVRLAGGDSGVALFLSEAVGEIGAEALHAEIVDAAAIAGLAPLRLSDRIVLRE